jgi:hypothetical protein
MALDADDDPPPPLDLAQTCHDSPRDSDVR